MHKYIYRLMAVGGLVWLTSAGGVQAADTGSYLKLDGGANIAQDVSINGFDLELDTGFRFGIAPGVILNDLLSVELETGFVYNEFTDSGGDWLGHVPFLVSLIVQRNFDFGLTPFIGVGAGGVMSIIDVADENDTSFAFAWQGQAGLRYNFNEHTSVGVVYKYLGVNDPEFELFGIDFEVENVHNHYIGAQFNFNF